jgi:hypothetical protein
MGALLALIPFKDWVYGGIILSLLIGFGVYTVHERNLGAAHEVAALKASSDKLTKETAAQTAALKAQATTAEQNYVSEQLAGAAYRDAHPIQPVRLCINTSSGSVVSASSGKKPGDASTGTGTGVVQSMSIGDSSSPGPDIGPMLQALAARADQVSATLREFQARE